MNSNELMQIAVDALAELKGVDVQVLDVQRMTNITDFMVVASGRSARQVVALAENERRIFVVAEIQAKFHAPARLSDELIVTARLTNLTRVAFDIEQNIYRDNIDGELLISSQVKAAYLDADTMRPKRMPPSLFGEHRS